MFDKILNAFGGGILSGVSEVVGKFVEDPTKKAELTAALAQEELKVQAKLIEMEVNDRDSARKREIELKDRTPAGLAWLVVVGYIGAQYYLFTHIIPAEMRDLVMRTLGTVDMALGMVLSYYFGAMHGKKDTK